LGALQPDPVLALFGVTYTKYNLVDVRRKTGDSATNDGTEMGKNAKIQREILPGDAPGPLGRASLGAGLTIRALEVFVVVAKTGTMVAAAKQLKLSQPAISQMIASLEQSLGLQLFDRSIRPPVLTLQGTTLIKHAAAITESVRQFHSTVRLGTAAQLPLLRIGILNSFATTMGPYIFKQLRNIAAEWSIDSGFHATRFRTVIDRDFDFAITADESSVPDEVDAIPILTEPFLLIVPAKYKGRNLSLDKIAEELDLIRFGRDPTLHSRFDRALETRGVIAQHRYHLDTTEAVLAMVAVGSGWTILPPLAVIKSIQRGDPIRALPFPGKPFQRTINVVSLKNESRPLAQRIRSASIDALKKHFMPSLRELMPKIARLTTLHSAAK
jgi:DNA-binding transcriptional LysR family regulator